MWYSSRRRWEGLGCVCYSSRRRAVTGHEGPAGSLLTYGTWPRPGHRDTYVCVLKLLVQRERRRAASFLLRRRKRGRHGRPSFGRPARATTVAPEFGTHVGKAVELEPVPVACVRAGPGSVRPGPFDGGWCVIKHDIYCGIRIVKSTTLH